MKRLPSRVALIGKGPSIDRCDWSQICPVRMGINETAYLCPNCTHAIALDDCVLAKYMKHLDPEILVCLRNTSKFVGKFPNEYVFSRQSIIQVINGTATVAIQLLMHFGARVIHFIGFDSMSKERFYANSIIENNAIGWNPDGFECINRSILQLVKKLGVICVWEHDPQCLLREDAKTRKSW